MKRLVFIGCAIAVMAYTALATVDHDPKNAGTSLGRNVTGSALDGPLHNPALLGTERPPKGGLLLFPITDLGLGYWSDKLAVNPFTILGTIPDTDEKTALLISRILKNSFSIKDDDSPAIASDKLTKGLKGGASLYTGARTSLLSFANGRVGFDVMTHMDEAVHVPEAPFLFLFSNTDGLLPGNTLDFSSFRQDAIWATDFSFKIGLPVNIPALHEFFKLKYGAGGIGIKYVMGHSILHAEASKGSSITYDAASNSVKFDGEVRVQAAGLGMSGMWRDWQFKNPFEKGLPINGHGLGVEIGGLLYDEKGALAINVENLGVLFWLTDVQELTMKFKRDSLALYEVFRAMDQFGSKADSALFDRNKDQYWPNKDNKFTKSYGFVTFLPLNFNMGYAYTWNFTNIEKQPLRLLSEYTTLVANFQEQLTPGPGRSYIPRLSLGGEAGLLRAYLPIRAGWVFGGPELLASNLGFGINFKYFSIQAAYKAMGNLLFWPQRGFEVAGGLNINWGMRTDSDRDGIVDKDDKCPMDPEDKDSFEDNDGCPDPDNDKDELCDPWVSEKGLLDKYASVCHGIDKCPNQPEDKDSFEDDDGCPDYDNDQDGIPDSLDKCPMEKEDKDNFQDQDGCPDYDNDGDGVPDSVDQCPILPEDIDGFEDSDGCPDYDNDKDGIPDSTDQCINQPETFNGYNDVDGCPDTLAKPTEKETKALNTKLRAINFKTASAELTSDSYTALNFVVGFLKQYPYLRYEIQGHTDSQGGDDYNLLLSAARAGSVSNYLKSQGIADSSIIAIGYGETTPIAPNTTAAGRAQNRRVDFKIIETREQYNQMKQQEADFQLRIREAKIKGAGY